MNIIIPAKSFAGREASRPEEIQSMVACERVTYRGDRHLPSSFPIDLCTGRLTGRRPQTDTGKCTRRLVSAIVVVDLPSPHLAPPSLSPGQGSSTDDSATWLVNEAGH